MRLPYPLLLAAGCNGARSGPSRGRRNAPFGDPAAQRARVPVRPRITAPGSRRAEVGRRRHPRPSGVGRERGRHGGRHGALTVRRRLARLAPGLDERRPAHTPRYSNRPKRPIAELTPVPIGGRLGDLPDVLASLPPLGNDAADFAADIDRAREELGASGVGDPWAS